ncbi:MAG: hypothetical protein ACMUJM_12820 [bacterium]
MRNKIFTLFIFICIIICAASNILFAQAFNFESSPPRLLDETTASLWPIFSSNVSVSNPVFNLNAHESLLAGSWASRSSEDLLISTYTGSYFGTSQTSSFNPLGGTTTVFSELTLPWVSLSTNITTSQSIGTMGFVPVESSAVKIQYQVSSQDNPYANMNPYVAGVYALQENAAAGLALDRVLAEKPLYTASGQRYYGTASYYNPYSTSGYFFPEQTSTSVNQMTTVGGIPIKRLSYQSSYYPKDPYPAGIDYPVYYYGYGNTGASSSSASTSYPTVMEESYPTVIDETYLTVIDETYDESEEESVREDALRQGDQILN